MSDKLSRRIGPGAVMAAVLVLVVGCGQRPGASDPVGPVGNGPSVAPLQPSSKPGSVPSTRRPSVSATVADSPRAVPTPTGPASSRPSAPPSPLDSETPDAGPSGPPGAVMLPFHGSDSVPAHRWEAAIGGNARRGCVWLDRTDGVRMAVLFPKKGYYALFNPMRVYHRSGREVWRGGEVKDIGGGPSSVYVERLRPECRTGDLVFWLTESFLNS